MKFELNVKATYVAFLALAILTVFATGAFAAGEMSTTLNQAGSAIFTDETISLISTVITIGGFIYAGFIAAKMLKNGPDGLLGQGLLAVFIIALGFGFGKIMTMFGGMFAA